MSGFRVTRHWTGRSIGASINPVRIANYFRAGGRWELLGVLMLCTLLPILAEDIQPNKYLPSIQERERYSDIVCSATIVRTHATSSVKHLAGEERREWTNDEPFPST